MAMTFRPLGRTGVQVSPLCLGCMMFGGKAGEAESNAIIDRALDAGINFLDTADVYSRGRSEEVTGAALARDGRRARVVLATKFHSPMDDHDPNRRGASRRHIIRACEDSLRRLQTDWIDLYQMHRPNPQVPIDETLRALDDLVRSGKVRYLGTSNFAAWQLVESLWAARELGLNRFVSEQPGYNLLDRRIERELVPMARTHGFALIPWSPLAGGYLTGKYRRGQPPPPDGRIVPSFFRFKPLMEQAAAFDVLEGAERLAQARGCTVSQFALAWVMHQPGITSAIIGPRTLDQLADNLAALDVAIADAERSAVDALIAPGTHLAPFYEADFGPAAHRW